MTALEGVRVVEVSTGLAGVLCGLQFVDAGADVIKLERTGGGRDRSVSGRPEVDDALFQLLNRGKRSVVLKDDDEATAQRLLASADVLIEEAGNCRHDLHLSPVGLQDHGRLIHVLICPADVESGLAYSELELQGVTGHMAFLGRWGESPVRAGADIGALAAGMHAFLAATSGLFARAFSGQGQRIEVSATTALLSLGSHWLADFSNPDEYNGGATDPYSEPEVGYRCRDGNVILSFFGRRDEKEEPWVRLCRALGLAELLEDSWLAKHGSGYVGVGEDAQLLKPIIEQGTAGLDRDELLQRVYEIGGTGAPILRYGELFGPPLHPQLAAAGIVVDLERDGEGTTRAVLTPWAANEGWRSERQRRAAPTLGEHTAEVIESFETGEEPAQ